MGRTFPSYYSAQDPVDYAVNRPINQGSELTTVYNQNYLAAKKLVPLVVHAWPDWISSHTAADGSTYWTLGSWRRKVIKDFTTVTCTVRVKNLNDTNTGIVRFKLNSSAATASITVAASAAEYTASVDLTIDAGETTDNIEIAVRDPVAGNSGKLWIQAVTVYTKPKSSPLAGSVLASGFTPMDTSEAQAEAPLSSYLRSQQFQNLDAIYKTRVPGTVVTFAAHYDERNGADWLYRVQANSYKKIATLPCPIPRGVTRLGFAVQGWMSGGTGATFKITSQAGGAQESAGFGTSWTYGGANAGIWLTYASSIVVNPGASNESIDLLLKSNGTHYAYLAGLCVWMEDAS